MVCAAFGSKVIAIMMTFDCCSKGYGRLEDREGRRGWGGVGGRG